MNRTFHRVLALATALPLALGACADDEVEDAEFEVESDVEAPATEPMAPVSIQLQPIGTSGVTGEATALHGAQDVTIELTLQGLMEDREYEAKIASGTCAAAGAEGEPSTVQGQTAPDQSAATSGPGRNMGQDIEELELEVEGTTGTARTTVSNMELRPGTEAHIAVMGEDGMLVACGDIRGHAGGMGSGMGSGMGTGMGADSPTTGGGADNY